MARRKTTDGTPDRALRAIALRHPETQEGIACQGTALESVTVKARNKAFLFVAHRDGACHLRLKLGESRAEAGRLAAKEPGRYKIGAQGWAAVTFGLEEPPPLDLLERWIDESYRLIADPRPVKALPERAPPPPAKKKTTPR